MSLVSAVSTEWPQIVLIAITVPIAVAFHWFIRQGRSLTLLDQWAVDNGFKLLKHQHRWFAKGPFTFVTSRSQSVYRITVESPDGTLRHGWARCGNWLFGLFSSKVEVVWDAEWASERRR